MSVTGQATTVTCPHCGTRNRVPAAARGAPRCGRCHQPLPWIVEADETSFAAVVDADLPVLVDFWAAWCAPCRMVSPLVERAGADYAGRLKVVKLDVDAAPQVAGQFGIQGIPVLMLMRGGSEVDRIVGAAPDKQLRAWLDRHL